MADDGNGNDKGYTTRIDGDNVVITIPKALLEQELTHARLALPTPRDIATILGLETIAFAPADAGEAGTMDPPETPDGIERFLTQGGETILLYRANGFLERMSLDALRGLDYQDLSASSPLRQIAERRDLLDRAAQAYANTSKVPWYVHGFGIMMPNLGEGRKLVRFILDRQVEGLADAEAHDQQRIHFGYVDLGPTPANINVAAFRLFGRTGAVMDGFESDVYLPGVPYARVSHGTGWQSDPADNRHVSLVENPAYLDQVRGAFDAGYLGKALNLDKEHKPVELVFEKRVA